MRALSKLPGLLFGLMFAGGGLFFLSETALPTWNDWRAMQTWQPSRANLLSVSGNDKQTKARYRYQFDGSTFTGERVYVASFSDSIGSYHESLLTRLQNFQRLQEPIQIWVDPLRPEHAVIDRDMRWGLFALMSGFCSVFIAIGVLVSYFSITSQRQNRSASRPSLLALRKEWASKQREAGFNSSFLEYSKLRIAELEQDSKEETATLDWRKRKGWSTSEVRSDAKNRSIMMWGFAIFWNAVTSPLLFVLPQELGRQNYAALFALLFPLAGIFIIYKAIASTLEYRRFGRVLVEMDPFPGAIGGHVGGRIRAPKLEYAAAVDASSKIAVRLECVYSYISGSGDSRSRRESIKWAEEGQPQIESSGQGVTMPFRFDVPDELPEADVNQTGAYHFWRLSVKAEIPGTDLNRNYNIPVFRTGEQSRFVRHNLSAQVVARKAQQSEKVKAEIAQGNFDIPGLSRAMRFSDQDGEIRMAFPMFRNKVLTVFAAIFAGGFGFASYMMMRQAFEGGGLGLFVGFFALPFLLVAIVATIATIYLLFNNLRVHLRSDRISVM